MTADRWARVLRDLGHRVTVEERFSGGACDVVVALHARKSARSIAAAKHAGLPVVLALTGTDVYHDIDRSPVARRSLALADRIVVLQPLAADRLPRRAREKARVVYQSVEPPRGPRGRAGGFPVAVLGHLRAVKDPFRAALAARRLPPVSGVRVVHVGGALAPAMARRARREEAINPRYRWLGEVSRPRARRLLARSRLLVLSSRLEGGANVIGEAVVLGVPVLASRIDGTVGLLGPAYAGFFPVGDDRRLAALLLRAERDPGFYRRLARTCARRASLFRPSRERRAWRSLLAELRRAPGRLHP